MKKLHIKLKRLPSLGLIFCLSCSGSSFNVTGYLALPFEDNAVDQRSKAYSLYDKGKYEEALEFALRSFELDSTSEESAVLLASIHMGLAGIDSFQLVENLISQNEGTALQEDSNAASSLAGLSDLVGLSTTEYTSLTLTNNEKDGVQGAPTSGVFAELPVLLPKSAVEARISGGDTIYNIAQAIEVLCPFVGEDVKILGESGDIRHTDEACAPQGEQRFRSKSHFNWAFAHLAEAILFNGVVLYAPTSETPNLQARGAVLDDPGVTANLTEYIAAVNELAAVTDIIMPTDQEESANSMLLAMFNDLEAASLGFSSLAGLPESVSGGIVSSLSDLQSQRDSLSPATDENESSSALKNQLTSGLAGELQSQITAKSEAGELDSESQAELCTAYDSISTEPFDICDN
ncbi:hypothetical protein [Pseudobacteriovorax antillogorgiicola]|uniref:Tetratricopeptide repeat-containing protein n=1 Tax=Pseudobacteriovorax antillogorgiicola TaxID=1513793 RepID=A0A1Y6C112_9BACT|nr:hypothetical protein [Pseudobacteriovorax antillogorgiicola]TCS51148.1 hypothetical protein EDD56_11131 [Pseudobacteriovorax antillogorgiicola]SMF38275.1 hypothetical protein SAMN06296036_111147 [Pseudobacteriovorax antillogorgiicola]